MHLSVERLIGTIALLALALAVMPQFISISVSSSQSAYDPSQEFMSTLLNLWLVDLVVVSVSVEHVSLTLSTIPFVCIFPTALIVSMGDYDAFARILLLAVLTIGFVVARFIANSI
jgi:hypothetical protein